MLHTGKVHENIELYVDGWAMKNVKDVETGEIKRQDILEGSMEISHLDSDKYLGQTLSADGKNTSNIEKMKNKGIGIQNRIIQMLEVMSGGRYHFQIAVILRNSLLISSILSSSEVWYGITQSEYEQLERVDEMLIRNLMNCSSSVPKDLLYLELALLPIRFIIQIRRLLYLHHILQQKEDSLLYKFFMAQLTFPTPKDWVTQVLEDIENLSIELEIEEIKIMKKSTFKKIVKKAVHEKAFSYLQERKNSRNSDNAKGKKLIYSEFVMAEYLCPGEEGCSIDEQKWLFQCRVEDIDIKSNHQWKHKNKHCSSCKKGIIENQSHILYCESLLGKNQNLSYIPDYEDLYKGDIREQIYISRLLKENFNNRVPDT